MDILDLAVHETGSGGDFNIKNNDIETINGLTNQVYLALFGGNIEESTTPDLDSLQERNDWWANTYLQVENQFNSLFEKALTEVALTSAGISVLVDAAKNDLKYLNEYADITVVGSIPDINKFQLDVELKQPNVKSEKVTFIWDGTRKEIIQNVTI